jgi:GR25 family glycosyltransferase involved in LPS biosynthesis
MKIGSIIINSNYPTRQKYVNKLELFFKDTDVICKQINGVFTDRVLYDARFNVNCALTKGQAGCALAHVNALKTAIDMDLDYVFIFEDDVEIIVSNYDVLKKWLDDLPRHDICLITNVGTYQGIGSDIRLHKNIRVNNNYMYSTCPFGTQSYYIDKNIIKLLYETQLKMIEMNKIYIADGLHIHCKKNPKEFLTIVTPYNNCMFFKQAKEDSIIEIVSNNRIYPNPKEHYLSSGNIHYSVKPEVYEPDMLFQAELLQ